jgi:hypothetical protein
MGAVGGLTFGEGVRALGAGHGVIDAITPIAIETRRIRSRSDKGGSSQSTNKQIPTIIQIIVFTARNVLAEEISLSFILLGGYLVSPMSS